MSRPFCPAAPLFPSPRFSALRSSWDSLGREEDSLPPAALTARLPTRPKHSLLSPVPRNKKVPMTETLSKQRPLLRLSHIKSLSSLQKGFNLLNSLYSPMDLPSKPVPVEMPRKEASMPEIPLLFTSPSALKPKADLKISAYRSEPSSASVLFAKEPSSPSLRRQTSIRMEAPAPSPPEVPENKPSAPVWKEQILIPVLKMQEIDAAELSNSSSSSDEGAPFTRSPGQALRRSLLMQRPTERSVEASNSQSPMRDSQFIRKSQEIGRNIKAEYQLETADMLSNTKFRIKSRKSTYVVPQRLLKGL